MTVDDGIVAVPGLGTVPSVLQILRTDGTVDNTGWGMKVGMIRADMRNQGYELPDWV